MFEVDWISWILGRRSVPALTTEPLAEIRPQKGETQTQRYGDFFWAPVIAGEKQRQLSRKDAVLTGESAQSELVFIDGLALILGPRTWVEIDRTEIGGKKVKLKHGSLRVQKSGATPFQIELGDTRISVAPQSLVELDESELKVKSGEAQIKKGNGPTIRLGNNEVAQIDPTRALSLDIRPLIFLQPLPDSSIEGNLIQTHLRIKTRGQLQAPIVLELSRNERFSADQVLAQKTIPLTERVPPEIKSVLQIEEKSLKEIKMEKSEEHFTVYLRARTRDAQGAVQSDAISLDWAPHFIQRPPTQPQEVPASPVKRVAPIRTGKIEIKKKKLPPPPPEDFDLKIKTQRKAKSHSSVSPPWTALEWTEILIPSAQAAETLAMTPEIEPEYEEDTQVEVSWRAVPGATRYSVQTSTLESFASIAAETKVEEPNWKWSPGADLLKKTLYFRVASIGEDGEVGGYSRAKPIAMPAPIAPPVFSAGLEVHTGLGNFTQSGGNSGLNSVQGISPYFQNKLGLEANWARTEDQFSLRNTVTLARFHAPNTTPTTLQPSVTAFAMSGTLLRQSVARRSKAAWAWNLGLGYDWLPYWEKTSIQVVDPRYRFSLGPAGGIMRNWGTKSGWTGVLIPVSTELQLQVPLTGLLTQGNWGLTTRLATEWKIYSKRRIYLGIRLEGEMQLQRFQTTGNPTVVSWALWLSPVFHWGTF